MMGGDRREIQELKDIANARLELVLGRLGVRERPRGGRGTILICDPMTADNDPSLAIWTRMAGGLSWKRYGGDAQGDIIDLVSYLKGWWHLPRRGSGEAIAWLRDVLGIRRLNPRQAAELAQQSRARRLEAEKNQAELAARRQAAARAIWFDAEPKILDTPAETYLREARGIDLRADPFIGPRGGSLVPSAIRFAPLLKHVDQDTRTETLWPAIVTACVDYSDGHFGQIRAVHRTYLAPDGRSKAPVAKAKMVLGAFTGLVMPLWRGDANLPVREAIEAGLLQTLVLTEGLEDGLSAIVGNPAPRIWAAISLDNIGNVPLPACIDGVIVHQQNDEKRQAALAFERALGKVRARGVPVALAPAFAGKDLNDTLRGAA